MAWGQPGGWADCGTKVAVTVPPGYPQTGMIAVAIDLPASLLLGWASGGASNHGFLLRSPDGGTSLSLLLSQYAKHTPSRPALEVQYIGSTPGDDSFPPGSGPSPSPAPSPPPCVPPSPLPPPPAVTRAPDGSCAVLPGSHWSFDISGAALHPNSACVP